MSKHPGWKKFEGRVAKWWGPKARRRGADFRGKAAGKDDLVGTEPFSVEVTVQRRLTFGELIRKCKQSEKNADGKIPIVVAKLSGAHDAHALVIMRATTFTRVQGLSMGDGLANDDTPVLADK